MTSDKREIARLNEMKILVILGKMNNEPLHIARIIREGKHIQGLGDWNLDKTTIPGIRTALSRLDAARIVKPFASKSEIRHRETKLYRIVPTLDVFSRIANNYGLGIVSFLRSSKFGQLVLVEQTPAYISKKLTVDVDALAECSDVVKEIIFLAQKSERALKVLLSPSLTFDRDYPKDGTERVLSILTYLRDVMHLAYVFDVAESSKKKLAEEGTTLDSTLSTTAMIENKEFKFVSNIRTDKVTLQRVD